MNFIDYTVKSEMLAVIFTIMKRDAGLTTEQQYPTSRINRYVLPVPWRGITES